MHSECCSDLLQLFQQISKWRFNFFQLFVAPRQTNKLFAKIRKKKTAMITSCMEMTHFWWLSVRRQLLTKTTKKSYVLNREALQNIFTLPKTTQRVPEISRILRQLRRSPETFGNYSFLQRPWGNWICWSISRWSSELEKSLFIVLPGSSRVHRILMFVDQHLVLLPHGLQLLLMKKQPHTQWVHWCLLRT